MASSSSRPRTWRYRVFTSFHGPDVPLTRAGNIAGEHLLNWDKESEMIEKIASDVSNKLNATISRDFEDMVGIEAHLRKIQTLLHLDDEDGAMIVGICGPAGIGKTTIARALHSRLSSTFQLSCFMENLRGSCNSGGLDNLSKEQQSFVVTFHWVSVSWVQCYAEDDWEILFNYKVHGHVKAMLADSNLDVRLGLKTLAYKSLIQLSSKGEIVIHKLLQQVGIQAIQKHEHWKRHILVDTDEIRYVLEKDIGSTSLMGICFDISTIKDSIKISPKASKRMHNLQFLKIYKTRLGTNVRVHLPEDMNFPRRLKLLHWEEYPGKCLPHTFRPENLVELNLEYSKLRHLWKGTQ
ncbi:hypothetical protein DY000_02012519, partial [Brassica cretica]